MTERGDPGRIDLSHETYTSAWRDRLAAGLILAAVVVVGIVVGTAPAPKRPTCPDGYALAGGTVFAGFLYHCVPGVAPVWR